MENIFQLTSDNINNEDEWPDWLTDIPSSITTNEENDGITINFSGGRKLQAEIGDFIILDKNNKIAVVEGEENDFDEDPSFEEICQNISELENLDEKEMALISLGELLLHTISPADENMDENLQTLAAEARLLENKLEGLYITAARAFYRYMIKHPNKPVLEETQGMTITPQPLPDKKNYN